MTILIPGGSDSKKSAFCVGNRVWSLGRDDLLEKGMATHSSILAWRILQTEEPGGLQTIGSQRVWHGWATNTFIFTLIQSITNGKIKDTKYRLSENEGFQGGASGKESACKCRSMRCEDSVPGCGRSPGEGNGHPLQYSCLENPTDRGDWWATVHGSQRVGHSCMTNTFTFHRSRIDWITYFHFLAALAGMMFIS